MQISAEEQELLFFIDCHEWTSDLQMQREMNKLANFAKHSEGEVKRALRETRKFTFEQVFRQATKEEVRPCVALEKTWFLKPNLQLPTWSYDFVYGILKHCR
jgi:hypothetical protein